MNRTNAYRSPIGYHRHACLRCGCVWEHADTCLGDDESHVCPGCQESATYHRYEGNAEPEFREGCRD